MAKNSGRQDTTECVTDVLMTFLMSFMTYFCTDPQQDGIYLFDMIIKPKCVYGDVIYISVPW